MKILLIEDCNSHILLFSHICKNLNTQVFSVENLPNATQVLENEHIDLIFLDGNLGKEKGVDYVKTLLSFNTPIVAHSSDDAENTKMLLAGAKATLNKRNLLDKNFKNFIENVKDCFPSLPQV